ncbi:MAG: ABC transporter ATP-binding protein [Pseudomonadota bacterium]|jgi:NitT/TauT family transport system ATP-binding protein|uniref:ABC-type nitrate/sulfonate/bicarbonate transport system, ATPase component n=1 Tax=Caballeronia sordidicola TaxID=196367 RepID=A0A242M6M0_CABSO|nr:MULTISPECIES: ABC transporter ATP-binding protein [Burkholderiaceae]AME24618.1 nitrate/sulfonate/bicarbonate ABC transporter ATP-binding protein [Burkholderia sp. PAMC 26561]AMM13838.1 nitrate/sulfonate/bicarbonate ABC transporter ATP-binding protein [Burkholderia sp. PAMC 28687]MDP9155023.1 ABC transporter ATP-binding protein [Pseudomonadota bacterium]OTP66836.1 ABC-type nitrate/sulfonate/bicarbonate transport system, ATPase component [Caballeronia sordidicola]
MKSLPLSVVPASNVERGESEIHATLTDVTRFYAAEHGKPPFHALGPVSLSLQKGEFFSVVGPSGCGKSTLLDVIAGLNAASSGTVMFEGAAVRGKVPEGVAVVFQEDATFPWLDVYDNAAFGARRAGVSESEIRERVEHALAFMGLKAFTHSYPVQLSGGMRQRVCIARAMVVRPRLMLLDEPFGALDQQTRLLMGEEMLKLWRETGATVMLITHSIDEAVLLSDRIGVMSACPGRFIETIHTGWSRQRDSNTALDPRFGELTARVWGLLRSEALKALGSQT